MLFNRALIQLIRCYQVGLAPLIGPRCRFYPSCSRYAVTCLSDFSFARAMAKIAGRLLRCHPWHPGGVDWP